MQSPLMKLDEILNDPPLLHAQRGSGQETSLALDADALRQMAALVRPGASTLETGAGLSTVVFAALGCHHIAIAPDAALFDRIRAYCDRAGIDRSRTRLIDAPSQRWLATADLPPLDFALIDGDHSFPAPFVDYHYLAHAIAVGGRLAVDDTHLLTGEILRAFLRDDPHWESAADVGRLSIFRKVAPLPQDDGWERQPFMTNGRRLTPPTGDTASRATLAWRACDRGDYMEVLALTGAPARSEHEEFERRHVRGRALRGLGRFDEALSELKQALAISRDAPAALRECAWTEIAAERAESAAAYAREAVRHAEDLRGAALAHDALGFSLMLSGRYDDAIRAFDTALSLVPDPAFRENRAAATIRKAWRACETGEFAAAVALVPEPFQNAILEYDRLVLLSHALRRQYRLDDAEPLAVRAADIDPARTEAFRERAWIAWQRQQADDAIRYAQQACARTTDDFQLAAAFDVLGVSLLLAGRPAEALEALDRASTLAPRHPWAVMHRAKCLMELGRLDEARQDVTSALEMIPDDPEANRLRAELSAMAQTLPADSL